MTPTAEFGVGGAQRLGGPSRPLGRCTGLRRLRRAVGHSSCGDPPPGRRRRGAPPPAAALASDGAVRPAAGAGAAPAPAPAPAAEHAPLVVAPEDMQLPPGQLSPVDRDSPAHPADALRCAGCADPACAGPSGCAAAPWRAAPGGYLRAVLTARVYDVAVETPLDAAPALSARLGSTVLLKREDLQPVRSFKLRGAYNKMASLPRAALDRGVVCSSAGNHAQGVALAAARLGAAALIFMPATTPEIKVAAVRALGARVELVGESYQEAQAAAIASCAATGAAFVHPYDDPLTIAGQGTVAAEIMRQCDGGALDAIFVAVGGGGLAAGIAAYVKALRPEVRVIGVEPAGANAMAQSLAAGRRVTLSKVDAFADGVAVKHVGAETFRLCRALLDGVVLVDNAATSAAIRDVFNETRSILEPAGAVAVAGAKAYLRHYGLEGRTVVAVTSGANMNFDRLRLVAELAGGAGSEAMLVATIPERPGAFLQLVAAALGGGAGDAGGDPIDVTEFKYRYVEGAAAHVLFGLGVPPGSGAAAAAVARLEAAGFPAADITDIELAQVHLRHLVGGRARGAGAGPLPHERIFQVDFPERPGALAKFLPAVSPRWNVTLFHYRRTGGRSSGVLLGLQVPPGEDAALAAAVGALGEGFSFAEIEGRARHVFDMFIE